MRAKRSNRLQLEATFVSFLVPALIAFWYIWAIGGFG